jgi:hypothetical protein
MVVGRWVLNPFQGAVFLECGTWPFFNKGRELRRHSRCEDLLRVGGLKILVLGLRRVAEELLFSFLSLLVVDPDFRSYVRVVFQRLRGCSP